MKPTYPRGFLTPEGRALSIKRMASLLAFCRAHREAEIIGWNWYPTQAWMILAEFRRGLNDRINRR